MDKYDILFIRACKKLHVSHYALKRILSIRSGIPMVFVQMEDVLGRLVEIVVKYDLADLNKFYALFMDKVRYDKLSIDLGHTTQSASPLDIFLQTVIVEIRLSAIAKFPGFISPRRFRK